MALVTGLILLIGIGKTSEVSKRGGTVASAKTNEERISYLKTFGWNVEEEACEIVEVAIPSEFDDVYQQYNELQKKQNFDLEPYRGKRVKRYSYEVLNYPGETENIRANLLVYNDQIIGGDVCSLKLDGFMHGFRLDTSSGK